MPRRTGRSSHRHRRPRPRGMGPGRRPRPCPRPRLQRHRRRPRLRRWGLTPRGAATTHPAVTPRRPTCGRSPPARRRPRTCAPARMRPHRPVRTRLSCRVRPRARRRRRSARTILITLATRGSGPRPPGTVPTGATTSPLLASTRGRPRRWVIPPRRPTPDRRGTSSRTLTGSCRRTNRPPFHPGQLRESRGVSSDRPVRRVSRPGCRVLGRPGRRWVSKARCRVLGRRVGRVCTTSPRRVPSRRRVSRPGCRVLGRSCRRVGRVRTTWSRRVPSRRRVGRLLFRLPVRPRRWVSKGRCRRPVLSRWRVGMARCRPALRRSRRARMPSFLRTLDPSRCRESRASSPTCRRRPRWRRPTIGRAA
jgi:hypothetical protein